MMKKFRLAQFESIAQRLVEGSFSRLLGSDLEPLEVASRLARALEDGQQDGRAPDVYTISLNPADFEKLKKKNGQLEIELAKAVVKLAQQADLRLKEQPQIQLTADPELKTRRVRVQASFHESVGNTTQLNPITDILAAEKAMLAELSALDAYLIVDGGRHVALERSLLTIGRRTDNDLVVDAPTVSRRHAQIRWRYGRFVLYDLSGRPGRTLVNTQPITEYALQSGDVISLANVKLIYGEGEDERQTHKNKGFEQEETLPKPKIE
jgi:pSer/pThr/pTyr-binding forkhead associated (FHA) protein